jgi:hypothetical protein
LAKQEKPKKYYLINNNDGNDQIDLQSTTSADAYEEALEILGYTMCVKEFENED